MPVIIPGGRYSGFQVKGMKLSIPGFFWVGKFGKYFLGIRNNLKTCGSARLSRLRSSVNKVQSNKIQHVIS